MSYFKSAATKIAHSSTIPALGGNKDLKALQDLILAEKAVLQTLQKLSHDFTKSSECLKIWGNGEGEDLGDVLSASTMLFSYVATALTQFATHEATVRDNMKAVRTREENLDEMRRRRKALGAKAEAADKRLQKMNPENKNLVSQTELLNSLREQIRSMDWEIITEEARLSDFKRTSTKNWMMLKFGGLLECAEKATIVGELGRLLIDEIPLEATGPGQPRIAYTGHDKTANLLAEAQRCVSEVVFDPQFVNEVNYMNMPQPSPNAAADSGSPAANGSVAFQMPSPHHSPNGVSFPSPSMQHRAADSVTDVRRMSGGGFDEFGVSDGRERVHGSIPGAPIRSSADGYRAESFNGQTTHRPRGNSGQFATFPVRTSGAYQTQQSNPSQAYQLRDESPARVPQESFSSEVNKALQDDPRTSGDGRLSPAPTYETHWNPPAGTSLPKGAAPPQTHNSRYSYMHQPPTGPRPVSQSQAISANQDVPTDVSVDSSAPESDEDGTLLPYARDGDKAGKRLSHEHVKFGNEDLIPEIPSQDDRREDDRDSLNAAAAREVSREMDSLNFQPPSRPSTITEEQTPSPSQFPAPPSFNFASPPHPGTPTAQDARNEKDLSTSSLPLRPPQAPFALARPTTPNSAPLAPPTLRVASRIPSPAGTSVYATPSETANASPFSSRSVSSPVTTPPTLPGGPRTISAAAFKRPQHRMASGPMPNTDTTPSSSPPPSSPTHTADGISPLSIKKRAMPNTPYPPGRGPGMPNVPPPPPLDPDTNGQIPPYDNTVTPTQASQASRASSPPRPSIVTVANGQEHDKESDTHDIISSYEDRGNGSPVQQDYGHLGHVRITNAEDGGYSQGKFATNLEDPNSLR